MHFFFWHGCASDGRRPQAQFFFRFVRLCAVIISSQPHRNGSQRSNVPFFPPPPVAATLQPHPCHLSVLCESIGCTFCRRHLLTLTLLPLTVSDRSAPKERSSLNRQSRGQQHAPFALRMQQPEEGCDLSSERVARSGALTSRSHALISPLTALAEVKRVLPRRPFIPL